MTENVRTHEEAHVEAQKQLQDVDLGGDELKYITGIIIIRHIEDPVDSYRAAIKCFHTPTAEELYNKWLDEEENQAKDADAAFERDDYHMIYIHVGSIAQHPDVSQHLFTRKA